MATIEKCKCGGLKKKPLSCNGYIKEGSYCELSAIKRGTIHDWPLTKKPNKHEYTKHCDICSKLLWDVDYYSHPSDYLQCNCPKSDSNGNASHVYILEDLHLCRECCIKHGGSPKKNKKCACIDDTDKRCLANMKKKYYKLKSNLDKAHAENKILLQELATIKAKLMIV